jgi:hypothetical protein
MSERRHSGRLQRSDNECSVPLGTRIVTDWLRIGAVWTPGLRRVPDLPSFKQYVVAGRYLRRL